MKTLKDFSQEITILPDSLNIGWIEYYFMTYKDKENKYNVGYIKIWERIWVNSKYEISFKSKNEEKSYNLLVDYLIKKWLI